MSRGQLTSFIIVGIVILFVIAFGIYFATIVKTPKPVIDTQPEKGNLRACLEQALDLAIVSISEHGGANWTGTNGTQLTPPGASAPYNLRFGIVNGNPPSGLWSLPLSQTGQLHFEPLCLLRGPNRPNASGTSNNDCLPGTYQLGGLNEETLQYQIALRTSANAKLCNVTDPVSVVFGADDVTASAGNLSVRSDARFKRLYNAARALALADIKDPYFDKRSVTTLPGCSEPQAGNECLLPGITPSLIHTTQGDIVTLTDSARKVAGGSLPFRYAVQNRAPSMIDIEPALTSSGYTMDSNTDFTVTLQAADSDEYDTLDATCRAEHLTASCSVNAYEFKATITLTLRGCTTSGLGVQDTAHVTVSDGALSSSIDLPVFLQSANSCP